MAQIWEGLCAIRDPADRETFCHRGSGRHGIDDPCPPSNRCFIACQPPETDDRRRVDVARAVAVVVAIEQQAAVTADGVDDAVSTGKEVAKLLPAVWPMTPTASECPRAVTVVIAIEQQAAVCGHGVDDAVAAIKDG